MLLGSLKATIFLFLALLLVWEATPRQDPALLSSAVLYRSSTIQKSNDDSVVFAVTVMDNKGRPISGLNKNVFSLYENKTLLEINSFGEADLPASIVVLFDMSGSMWSKESEFNVAREAFLHLVEGGNKSNEYLIVGFAQTIQIERDWTGNKEELSRLIGRLPLMRGKKKPAETAMYDACLIGLDRGSKRKNQRHILLLISDGQDNASHHTFKECREALKRSDVLLYSVTIWDESDPAGQLGGGVLDELSWVTGGRAFFPRNIKETYGVFDQITSELRHQYLIGFKLLLNDGKWHSVRTKVAPLRIGNANVKSFVRSRSGYYAPFQ